MGTINILNFEELKVNGTISLLIGIISIVGIFIKVMNEKNISLEIEENTKGKILLIKDYKRSIIKYCFIYNISIPIINITLFIIFEYVYMNNQSIKWKILFVTFFIMLIVIKNIFLLNFVRTKLEIFNIKSKYKLLSIYILIIINEIILIVLFVGTVSKVNIDINFVIKLSIDVCGYTFIIFYSLMLFFGTRKEYIVEEIEIEIDTKHYYNYLNLEIIHNKNDLLTEKDKLLVINEEGKIIRRLNKEWIKFINVYDKRGVLRCSLDNNKIKNIYLTYRNQIKRKLIIKKITNKEHA